MIYPIIAYGHPVLKKKSINLTEEQLNDKEFVTSLFETMDHCQGLGLAAPQVGKNLRVFVIDSNKINKEDDRISADEERLRIAFINPIMVEEYGELVSYEEGCLSIPNVYGNVERPEHIRIEFLDENLQKQKREFSGFTARIIQHEYDHIEGKLFTDMLKPIKKRMIQKKLNKIKDGQIHSRYKMKFV